MNSVEVGAVCKHKDTSHPEEQKPLFNVWRKHKQTGKWIKLSDQEVDQKFGRVPIEWTDPSYRRF